MTSPNDAFKKITVVGLGYIGLPTAATLATRGVEVFGVDINDEVVSCINEGKAHFSEPDLDILLEAAVSTGKLRAYCEPKPADAFIIAVPTPLREDRSADLSHVETATRSISQLLKPGNLIVIESTCPVGTTEKVCGWIAEERPDLEVPREPKAGDIQIAYCPERILPGNMVFELVHNDRIIGGVSPKCSARAEDLYRLFLRGEVLRTSSAVAELVKLAENAYRDVNIGFANELSNVCDKLGVDVWETIELANRHPRVNILRPGPGVGGHCIAVDPWFLISMASEVTPLMRAARTVNDEKPRIVVDAVRRNIDRFKRPTVACLGLAYKPDVDDLRESPALQIAETLAFDDIDLVIVEPHLRVLPETLAQRNNVSKDDFNAALRKSDIVVVLTAHSAFRAASREQLLRRVVIDTVGLWQS
ncbi:UDP-N-acetyl-D-mannosamine dehydrogenase [Dichotomicrobium thermohalophilum]|uniref:UDP-N-acetyl-D-mannosaminuronic acid dehydrogenase n=1 Tax=Dichotomicrobium thermohalophilum TaxID=933063 RepID=A0A397Q6E7_9HYPH|nr:UDP-N-acetyl-D-mannosamine dehydrogenase [Dichotomicrobium thermohalophilum]RIA56039.1 UDP-N-acetyl-D-mannosaminuronic acid dehydrogenase [Dichotomicrobium thermohalophilum]